MRTLFARVFVSFWIAMTVVGAAFVVIEGTSDEPIHAIRRENLFAEAVRDEAAVIGEMIEAGEDPLGRLRDFEDRTDATVFLFRPDGTIVSTRPPSQAIEQLARLVRQGGNRRREKDSAHLFGFWLDDGETVGVGRIRRQSTWNRALGMETLPERLLVIVVVSGIVSLLLARTLTRPIRKLRRATRRIAAGELDFRVAEEVGSTTEHAALARDFDAMAARIQELLGAREKILADVAHELNSPLARMRVAVELARNKAGEAATPLLDRIERDVERLGELVAQILAVSRADQAARVELDLTALIEEIVRDASFEARTTNRRVELVEQVSVTLLGDAEMLRRAVENVVRNALRFAPEGTAVEVRMREVDGAVEVSVSDHGPGVPDDALEAIFKPLFRVDPDRDRRTGGAGLGLAIVARAIAAHGGEVWAENAEGGGLRVVARLPRA